MKTLEQELKTLQEERQRIEVDMANANETILQTQHTLDNATSRRNELVAALAPLQRLANDFAANQSAIEAERQAAVREQDTTEASHRELLEQLAKGLPEARRQAIEASIKAVDTVIDDLKKTVQTLQSKIAEAEVVVAETQKRAADLDGSFRETSTQLRQLPGQIRQTRAQVAKLSVAANAAAASGQMGEAFYLAHELTQSLGQLSQLIGPEMVAGLLDRLDEAWRESKDAKVTAIAKTAALDQLRRDVAAKEGELQHKVQQREADIKAALSAAETAEMARVNH